MAATDATDAANAIDEHDAEVFDDNDFYQQLLKDLIASGNGACVVYLCTVWLEWQSSVRLSVWGVHFPASTICCV